MGFFYKKKHKFCSHLTPLFIYYLFKLFNCSLYEFLPRLTAPNRFTCTPAWWANQKCELLTIYLPIKLVITTRVIYDFSFIWHILLLYFLKILRFHFPFSIQQSLRAITMWCEQWMPRVKWSRCMLMPDRIPRYSSSLPSRMCREFGLPCEQSLY